VDHLAARPASGRTADRTVRRSSRRRPATPRTADGSPHAPQTRARGGPGGAQSNATIGSVANKKGSTLYVKDADGNLVKLKTTSHSKINRTASTSSGAIHPGDTVIVQGTTAKDGTLTATQVNATAAGATSGLGGLLGAFGGGGGQRSGDGDGGQAPPDGGSGHRAPPSTTRRQRCALHPTPRLTPSVHRMKLTRFDPVD